MNLLFSWISVLLLASNTQGREVKSFMLMTLFTVPYEQGLQQQVAIAESFCQNWALEEN